MVGTPVGIHYTAPDRLSSWIEQLELGIIGFGRFGRFAAGLLKDDFQITVYDRHKVSSARGIRFSSLSEVASKPILLLCVPISEISGTCRSIKSHLTAGQVVIDTCSVKKTPLNQMVRILPRFVQILGTHPLFGPDSGKRGIEGLKVVLCPVRCRCLPDVKRYLENRGLEVVVLSADRHDREMAASQALFHFLARGIAQTGIRIGRISTPGPAKLFGDLDDVQNDSLQLFKDLQTLNPYAKTVRRKLLRSLTRLDTLLSAPTKARVSRKAHRAG